LSEQLGLTFQSERAVLDAIRDLLGRHGSKVQISVSRAQHTI
jgi:hypothetical protein